MTVLEGLLRLEAQATPRPWVLSAGREWVWGGAGSSPHPILVPHPLHPSPTVRERANATYTVHAVNHLRRFVAAAVEAGCQGYPDEGGCSVMLGQRETAWCESCCALAALKRDIKEA